MRRGELTRVPFQKVPAYCVRLLSGSVHELVVRLRCLVFELQEPVDVRLNVSRQVHCPAGVGTRPRALIVTATSSKQMREIGVQVAQAAQLVDRLKVGRRGADEQRFVPVIPDESLALQQAEQIRVQA